MYVLHPVKDYNIKSIIQAICLAVFSISCMHGLPQISFWILVVNAARPCKTLSPLLTVMMILLPPLGGEEETVEEGCPDWDKTAELQGKRGWYKYNRGEEKAWKEEKEPVVGGTEEGVATEAPTPLEPALTGPQSSHGGGPGLDVVL